jgi:hypothetical protein
MKVTKLPPAKQEVFFQEHQFDKDLKRGVHPVGTTHIKRQGSEVEDSPEAHELWGSIQETTKEKNSE